MNQFSTFLGTTLGADPCEFDIYCLGNELKGEDTQLWKMTHVVPGAFFQMRKKRSGAGFSEI